MLNNPLSLPRPPLSCLVSAERTATGNTHSLTTWTSLAPVKGSSHKVQFDVSVRVSVCICAEVRGVKG